MKLPRLSRTEISVVAAIFVLLYAMLLPSTQSWYTCTKCGNEIEQLDFLSWKAPGVLATRRCLTRKPITPECRHAGYGTGAVVVKRNGFTVDLEQ